jgi:hypothetical protein
MVCADEEYAQAYAPGTPYDLHVCVLRFRADDATSQPLPSDDDIERDLAAATAYYADAGADIAFVLAAIDDIPHALKEQTDPDTMEEVEDLWRIARETANYRHPHACDIVLGIVDSITIASGSQAGLASWPWQPFQVALRTRASVRALPGFGTAHEVGHVLGLLHTFAEHTNQDECYDTPHDPYCANADCRCEQGCACNNKRGCDVTCGGFSPPAHNVMSYYRCLTPYEDALSPCQIRRARCFISKMFFEDRPCGLLEYCDNGNDDNCDGYADCADWTCAIEHPCCGAVGQRCCSVAPTCESGLSCDATKYCAQTPLSCPSGNGLYCGDGVDGRNQNALYSCVDGVYTLADDCDGLGCRVNPSGVSDACNPPGGTGGTSGTGGTGGTAGTGGAVDAGCTDECYLGEKYCADSVSTWYCGATFDGDSCLEYGPGLTCGSGMVCADGDCVASGTGGAGGTGGSAGTGGSSGTGGCASCVPNEKRCLDGLTSESCDAAGSCYNWVRYVCPQTPTRSYCKAGTGECTVCGPILQDCCPSGSACDGTLQCQGGSCQSGAGGTAGTGGVPGDASAGTGGTSGTGGTGGAGGTLPDASTEGGVDAGGCAAPAISWQAITTLPAGATTELGVGAIFASGTAIYVVGIESTVSFHRYDTDPTGPGTWIRLADLPEARIDGGMVAASVFPNPTSLYVLGAGSPTSDVLIYDVIAGTWSRGLPMPTPRTSFGTGFFRSTADSNGLTYAIGGLLTESAVVERYDVATNTWSAGPSLVDARGQMAVVNHSAAMYLFGGANSSRIFDSTERMVESAPTAWEPRAPMPRARRLGQAIARNAYVYVMGGMTQGNAVLDAVDVYEPATDTWCTSSPLPTPLYKFLAFWVVPQDKIYLFGGGGPTMASSQVYRGTFQ